MEGKLLWNYISKKNCSWFTLVELIVVITILAILGTIAFISLQGYSADARNTKRTSDLSNINTKVQIWFIEWLPLFSLLDGTWSTITASWTNIQISWRRYSQLVWFYNAWDINYSAINLDETKFLDPIANVPYKIWVTSLWTRYELAATIEDDEDSNTLVMWNWNPRTSQLARWNWVWEIWKNFYTLSSANILLETNDIVNIGTWNTSPDYKITRIKWNVVYLNQNLTQLWVNVYLKYDETRHLIKRWNSNWAIDIWKGDTYTPYKLK